MTTVRTTLRVIAVAFLIFFCATLLFAIAPFYHQMKVLRTWPAAEAQVVHSDVVPLSTASGQALYDTLLVLSYQVNGRRYVSSVGSLHQSTHYERKKKQADQFPAGSQTELHYNPEDPRQVQVQVGYNVHFFAIPIFISGVAGIFGLLALLFFVLSRRGPVHRATHVSFALLLVQ